LFDAMRCWICCARAADAGCELGMLDLPQSSFASLLNALTRPEGSWPFFFRMSNE